MDSTIIDLKNLKNEYTCMICQNIYENPTVISVCKHIFCNECLKNMLNAQNNNSQCPICRVNFSKNNINPDIEMLKKFEKSQVICECGEKMFIKFYNKHIEKCSKFKTNIQDTISKNASNIRKDKIGVNRNTFTCPCCKSQNLSREGLINHVKNYHPHDQGVCPICLCQPWGDPNYITHLYGHLIKRHKFDYDTTVDYNESEDDVLQRVLKESLKDY